ncbi:MAG TPA: quinoprotein dehydrogenase-associated putative ABC transporter substrate-binding protein [Steroidobacteraceae bacterium]|jgi:quinoprotein dehydrogenase-associated probable ABC transporter substrate-binding protein
MRIRSIVFTAALGLSGALGLTGNAHAAAPLRVCADPGNMPFSDEAGDGIENKMGAVLAKAMGTTVTYYYRPTIERGMTRNTLDADNCDVMMDMPTDSEGVLNTTPVYRTTFVLASRSDRHLQFKNLDDPRLKKLKVGVYQTSAIREALLEHDVIENVFIHYLSHDSDLVPEDAPSYQIQQVVDGKLDVAAAWGPFAGWYKAMKNAPITIQPVNLMEDAVPMEFDMALAVRRTDSYLQGKLEQALHEQRDAIHDILTGFGVPLVQCDTCLISGDLPSHGPYKPVEQKPEPPGKPVVTIAMLDNWLAHGGNVDVELNNAVIADDQARVAYLLDKKHANIDAQDPQGETPLQHALEIRSMPMVKYLLKRGASVSATDRDGWTPIMSAAWSDNGDAVKLLVAHHADANFVGPASMTPLRIALQYRKDAAALALIDAGADYVHPIGDAGYTPLMLAIAGHSQSSAQALIKKGADVNASNSGGVTALMIAAADGQPELAQLLVSSGANVSAQNERGDTALSIARDRHHDGVVRVLDRDAGPAASNPAHSGG